MPSNAYLAISVTAAIFSDLRIFAKWSAWKIQGFSI